jgi:hypothetical protein
MEERTIKVVTSVAQTLRIFFHKTIFGNNNERTSNPNLSTLIIFTISLINLVAKGIVIYQEREREKVAGFLFDPQIIFMACPIIVGDESLAPDLEDPFLLTSATSFFFPLEAHND